MSNVRRRDRPRPSLQRGQWRALRRAALARSRYRCERCGTSGKLEVHHVLPVAQGGPEIPGLEGVLALCLQCHLAAHGKAAPEPDAWDRFAAEL